MAEYEIASIVIASAAFLISFVSLYFSFRKHRLENTKLTTKIEGVEIGLSSISLLVTISNHSIHNLGIESIKLKLDKSTYNANQKYQYNLADKYNALKSFSIEGHQLIQLEISFQNIKNFNFRNAKLEIMTSVKRFNEDITKELKSAYQD